MASEEAAVTMVNYYTPVTPHLRSQPVYIQYSNHRELKTDNLPNQAVSMLLQDGVLFLLKCKILLKHLNFHETFGNLRQNKMM